MTYTPLSNEVRVAAEIVEQILDAGVDEDDADFSILLASETNVQDMLLRLLRIAREEEANAEAIAAMIRDLEVRKHRKMKRMKKNREVVRWAMEEMGLNKLNAPDLTATLGKARQSVVVVDDTQIPDNLCRIKREPMKTEIGALLNGGTKVPGCELSNATRSLTVRTA